LIAAVHESAIGPKLPRLRATVASAFGGIAAATPAVAHEMLEKLPLGKAHMMSFELIPIGPLNPLRFLQGMQPKP
jgi:hypothetical protein